MLLLICTAASLACTPSATETPGRAENNLISDPQSNLNGADQTMSTVSNRRLKSFYLDLNSSDLVDAKYQLEYADSGLIQQLVVPAATDSDSTAKPVNSFTYESGVLAQVVRKNKNTDYRVVDGKIVSKHWVDGKGNEKSTSYEYDADGNLIRVTGGFLDFLSYCQSAVNQDTADDNLTLSYEGQKLVSIVSDAGDISVVYGYNSNGLLSSRTTAFNCGNGGIGETFSYNENDQLTSYELKDEFKSPEYDGGLDTRSTYHYNEKGQIVSITRKRHRNEVGRTRELKFGYDSNDEIVSIKNGYDGIVAEEYTLTYEDGHCEEQTYTDPEFIVSPTHAALYVKIYPESLRCGYFLSSLDDR